MSTRPQHKHSHSTHKTPRKSTHLNLAVNRSSRPSPNRSPLRWSLALVVLSISGYAWMVGNTYLSTPTEWSAMKSVSTLLPALQNNGVEGYLVAKARLREQVRSNLEYAEEDTRRLQAEQVAVYLFPELLPESDFEKSDALANFSPRIDEIEQRPNTEAASNAFADLRAEIWNYENPSREEPRVSEVGNEILKLFAELSRH